jgi:3-hydroxyacyl-CoA dehydrogenase
MAVGRRIGKVPVLVGVCYGFVGNRMLHQRSKESERLLLEGALPQQVDRVLYDFGFPMGPFAMGDLAGLDVGWRIRKGRGERALVADRLCELGRFGQKTGAGFYRYEGDRTPRPDPDVEKIIVDVSTAQGITRRPISDEEIREWADSIGLRQIRDRILEYGRRTGHDVWRPAALLDRLADQDRGFLSP